MMYRGIALLGLLATLSAVIGPTLGAQIVMMSDSAARDALAEAHTLRCAFDSGVGFRYAQKAEPNTVPLLRPQPLKPGAFDNPQVIDNIDRRQRKARLILGAGAVTVDVLSGPPLARSVRYAPLADGTSVSFLWMAVNNPVVLTVFANRAPRSNTELVAVITRHMEWFGGVDVSQYYGRCAVLLG